MDSIWIAAAPYVVVFLTTALSSLSAAFIMLCREVTKNRDALRLLTHRIAATEFYQYQESRRTR